MTFDDLVLRLLSFRHQELGTGATEAEIDEASRALGVPIRGGYRMFLMRFGWGGVADFDIFGLGRGVPDYLNLIRVTERERTVMEPPIPEHLLPILNNGGGDHACLDTRACPDEPPVVWWWHEDGPDQIPEPDAPDFFSWLSEWLDARTGATRSDDALR